MWARSLRLSSRSLTHPTIRFSRKYANLEHKTYFQNPPQPPGKPPRRILRSILLGTTCLGLGAYAHSWLYDVPFLGIGLEAVDELQVGVDAESLQDVMSFAVQAAAAIHSPAMDLHRAQEVLETRSGYSVTNQTVAHSCQLASNIPCEDTMSSGSYTFFNDPAKDWCEWAIFDGHAGPQTSGLLKKMLPGTVGEELAKTRCLDRPYSPNDSHIINTIKKAFVSFDHELINSAREHVELRKGGRAQTISATAAAQAGSCALLALFDPVQSVLRVANTGDSRAVLGRWDEDSQKYAVEVMSTDQTGFNPDEVARLNEEHPDEQPVDPKTGRVLGIAVSRAFGDARWKWPNEVTRRAHELFCGPAPRPNDVVKTPPYLTAEPEVTETKIERGAHPDFLIMASDGLWDQISSEDAVACVQMWLEKNKPSDFLEKLNENSITGLSDKILSEKPTFSSISDLSGEDDDCYYDPEECCFRWKVSPKHFINEDENCGIHLVKNALGGKRRDLFTGLMSVQPPLSRYVRDDISVHVVFFGVDTQDRVKI